MLFTLYIFVRGFHLFASRRNICRRTSLKFLRSLALRASSLKMMTKVSSNEAAKAIFTVVVTSRKKVGNNTIDRIKKFASGSSG